MSWAISNRHTAAVAVVENGERFGSKGEHRRFGELKLLEIAGEIGALKPHPRFELIVNGEQVGEYTADAMYYCFKRRQMIVEDYKGRKFRDWPLRSKLFSALYPQLKLEVICD
jgi:hypothetical protein